MVSSLTESAKDSVGLFRGVARNLFRRGTKPEDWGQKSPCGVQRQSPGGGFGAKPPEADDIYANNHCPLQ